MDIRSERLSMTQISIDDWALFVALHTDANVTALCFDQPTMAEIKARFEARLVPWSTDVEHWLCLTIRHRITNEKLGVTGFCLREGVAEVGYLMLPKFHGQGYASESLAALLAWAVNELGIHRFKAVVTEGNDASARVLLKNGFELVSVTPQAYKIGGHLYADQTFMRQDNLVV